MKADERETLGRGWRHSLDFDIPLVGTLIHNVYNRAFRELGVTRSQAVALVFLAEYGPMSQSDLAQRIALGKAATGSLIRRMEEAGLLTRSADPSDGRNRLVALDAAGAELIDGFSVIGHEIGERLRDGITPAERRLVADVLERMRNNLEALEQTGVESGVLDECGTTDAGLGDRVRSGERARPRRGAWKEPAREHQPAG
jgi:DNA-binding MarR family transcriptional regulator